jgi:hypothetical protein
MDVNDGTNTGVEPETKGAPEVDGKEQQGSGKPEGTQSTGDSTQKGGNGSTKPYGSWIAQLPSDLKEDEEVMEILKDSPTIGDYVRKTLSKQDGSKAKEADQKNGHETEPVKYENFEKSLDADSDPFGVISESLKTTLEESGVSQEAAEKIFDAVAKSQDGSMRQLIEKGKDWCEAQLKKSWGDQYETKRKAMSRAYIALVQSDEALANALDRTGASINPAVAELLSRIGESIAEDGSISSNSTRTNGRNPRVPVHYPD